MKQSATKMMMMVVAMGFSGVAKAAVQAVSVNLQAASPADHWAALPDKEIEARLKKKNADALSRAAMAYAVENWKECSLAAKKAALIKLVDDWALWLRASCAMHRLEDDDKTVGSEAAVTFKSVQHFLALNRPEWASKKIRELRNPLALSYAEWAERHSHWKELAAQLQFLFNQEDEYNRQDRATLYYLAGQEAVADRHWSEAFIQFERSTLLSPLPATDSRLRFVIPMLSEQQREQILKQIQPDNTVSTETVTITPSSDEADLVTQAEGHLARNETLPAAEALASLLQKFPGGVKVKWAQQQLLSLLNQEIATAKSTNGVSVNKRKLLSIMTDLDGDRLYEWGKALFDSQAYDAAAVLLKKSADDLAKSLRGARSLYLAGRAFQLSNGESDAKHAYKQLLKLYPAQPEATDAALQWGLIAYSENDFSEAITHLEAARARKLSNQQDLISLFWLYRAYKAKNAHTEMTQAAQALMTRFPLTYYGIIAGFETTQRLPEISNDSAANSWAKIYLSDREKTALERARILLKAGLLSEASSELSVFFSRPLAPSEKMMLANIEAQAMSYVHTFSLLGSLLEDNAVPRTASVIKLIFPKEYWALVSDDKKRSGVDPLLLLSIMKQESAFDRNAISHSGAMGLLQMIPATAEQVNQELAAQEDIPETLKDPAVNIRFCAHYFAGLLSKFDGSVPLALAAYNAGPTRINQYMNSHGPLNDTWVDELPWSETSFYVKSILKNYLMYRIVYSGLKTLPTPPWTPSDAR